MCLIIEEQLKGEEGAAKNIMVLFCFNKILIYKVA